MRFPLNRPRHKRLAMLFALAVLVAPSAFSATLAQGIFRISYDDPDHRYASASLEILEEALRDYAKWLPAGSEPIRVVICRTPQEFYRYAGPYTQPNVGGIAESLAGLIVVKAPYIQQQRRDYPGVLRHELVHILLTRNTRQDYLPRWLNEGIAMTLAGEHRWGSWYRVARMYTGGHLLTYGELQFVLSDASKELVFGDAYAQSLSMTQYLMDHLGEEQFWALVHSLNRMPFAEALRDQTGLGPEEFFEEWRESLWRLALTVSIVSGVSVFQIMALLALAAYLRKRRLGRRILKTWEEEEQGPMYATWDEVVEPSSWEPDEDKEHP